MTATTAASLNTLWKDDVARALRHHEQWWNQQGPVLWLTAPKDQPWQDVPEPREPESLHDRWFDPQWCAAKIEYDLSRTYFGGDALPIARTWKAAGDLAPMMGSPIELAPTTVWMHPVIDDPDRHGELRVDLDGAYARQLLAITDAMVAASRGRWLVSVPDLVENVDILANLRGTEPLLMDMIERPDWVSRCVEQINDAWFAAFDLFRQRVRDERGGNTFVFNLWGPGRTAKVQCDACSMFGPAMFRQFVVPALTQQCRRLDYAMFHLDGETCLPNLDALLEIEPIRAVEWTSMPGTGGADPRWHDLYRRILSAGKSVQAIKVQPEEVVPLLDAIGPRGLYIMCHAQSEAQARALEEQVAPYYSE
jgi:hypothetical protein